MDLFNASMLNQVRQPVATANGLPNAFYTDADVFDAEKRVLFAETWACVGFGKDVAGNGMARPSSFSASHCCWCVTGRARSGCSRTSAVIAA